VNQRLARDAVWERNISHRPHRYQRYTYLDQNDWIKAPPAVGRSSVAATKWREEPHLDLPKSRTVSALWLLVKGMWEARSGSMDQNGVRFTGPAGSPSRKTSSPQSAAQRHGGHSQWTGEGGVSSAGQGPPPAAWGLWVPSALGNPAARYLMNGYARNRPGATRGKRRGSVAHQPARQGAGCQCDSAVSSMSSFDEAGSSEASANI